MPALACPHRTTSGTQKHPDRFYIVHYSSQSLYDEGVDGFSPRITSIVVLHYATRQTASFALHAVAESLSIPKDQVESQYDAIERVLLERSVMELKRNIVVY